MESAVPVRRGTPRVGARVAPPLLPVVARVAREAECAGPRARARSRRIVSRRRLSAPGAVCDGRTASAVASRDGDRCVCAALAARRLRRAEADRARLRRPSRPRAVHVQAHDRRTGRRDRACVRRFRLVSGLSRTHARIARDAWHRRSVSGTACGARQCKRLRHAGDRGARCGELGVRAIRRAPAARRHPAAERTTYCSDPEK